MEKFTGFVSWNGLVEALRTELAVPSMVHISDSDREIIEVAQIEERRFDLLLLLTLLTSEAFQRVVLEELDADEYEKDQIEFNRRLLENCTELVADEDASQIAHDARMQALEKNGVGYMAPFVEKKLHDALGAVQKISDETRAAFFRAIGMVFVDEPETPPKKRPEGFEDLLRKIKGLPSAEDVGEEEDASGPYGLDLGGWADADGEGDAA